MAVAAGDAWLAKGANLLLFGPPGGGKSHLASAIGLALVENGWKVLFTCTTDLDEPSRPARPGIGNRRSAHSKQPDYRFTLTRQGLHRMRTSQSTSC